MGTASACAGRCPVASGEWAADGSGAAEGESRTCGGTGTTNDEYGGAALSQGWLAKLAEAAATGDRGKDDLGPTDPRPVMNSK